uniref:Uncharacterized protein n=1 Tax=Caenorhabditis japonica TaxID=281687 RepID=A0A8R1I3S4_CAEJA
MQWDPQNNKKFQRSMSAAPPSGPPRTPYRPRSFSNNHNGTPARAPPSPPTVARVVDDPIIPERSIPVAPKIRQTVPWTAPNNRYHHPIVTSSFPMSSTTFTTSPVPLLPFPAQMALVVAPPPVGNTMAMMMPAMVVASPAQLRTTTTAYTVMDSSQQIPSPAPTSLSAANSPAPMPISIRTYTNHLRKSNPGTLTPEELGDALRSEHQRFHDTRDGEGPSVKSFLLNLHQK